MKFFLILILLLFNYGCSLNNESAYWNDDPKKNIKNKEIISKIEILNKSIFDMNYNEFKIFLDDYVKKSVYPSID
jgi:hypothetical protein